MPTQVTRVQVSKSAYIKLYSVTGRLTEQSIFRCPGCPVWLLTGMWNELSVDLMPDPSDRVSSDSVIIYKDRRSLMIMFRILLARNIFGDESPNPVGLELWVFVTACYISP
jgi:hypothetical protein